MPGYHVSRELVERLYWLTRLRWIAVAGVFGTTMFVSKVLGLTLPMNPILAIGFMIGIYNLSFYLLLKSIKIKKNRNIFDAANWISNWQISLDLTCLAGLIHLSGGIENPFIFYFIFHMITASILLSRRAAFIQATYAVFLFCSMVILEYFGILHHYCLKEFLAYDLCRNLVYIAGVSVVFISTVYIAVYMATSISKTLREKSKKLRMANKQLKDKDRIKSEYVLQVTHDVKSHLAAIQSCVGPVTAGITGELNEQQQSLLKRAEERTGKLLLFVKALLEITRMKLSNNITMAYFSLSEVVKNVILVLGTRAKNRKIDLEVEMDQSIGDIWGMKTNIEGVIMNVLANAIKYTPTGGKVSLSVQDKGESVLMVVKDSGIGIPTEDLPKVFDEFYRASNARKSEREGTGLGLSIAKQTVLRHKGEIWAESKENKGSTFYVLLPKGGEKL